MRSFLLIVLLLGTFIFPAAAAPSCTSQNLTDYIALGADGCSIDGLLFSKFEYFSFDIFGNVSLVPADDVSVDPILEPGRPGLSFSSNWSVANGAMDHLIFYEVSTLSGLPTISDAYLNWEFTQQGGISVASLDEFLCFGGSVRAGCQTPLSRFFLRSSSVPTAGTPSDHLSFAPVAQVGALKDVFVLGILGSASITRADNQWGQIPEPGSVLLAIGGLAGLLIIKSRRRADSTSSPRQ